MKGSDCSSTSRRSSAASSGSARAESHAEPGGSGALPAGDPFATLPFPKPAGESAQPTGWSKVTAVALRLRRHVLESQKGRVVPKKSAGQANKLIKKLRRGEKERQENKCGLATKAGMASPMFGEAWTRT